DALLLAIILVQVQGVTCDEHDVADEAAAPEREARGQARALVDAGRELLLQKGLARLAAQQFRDTPRSIVVDPGGERGKELVEEPGRQVAGQDVLVPVGA